MNDVSYSLGTFKFFHDCLTSKFGRSFQDLTVLEIGPGDSVAMGVFAYMKGAKQSFLIDSGDFATRDMHFYSSLVSQDLTESSFDEMLKNFRINYGKSSLYSLNLLENNSVDLIISNAVLEHISPSLLREYTGEFMRILTVGGIMLHRIDYRDHLTGEKFHKHLPFFISNSKFYRNSIMYLNRLTEDDYTRLFHDIGFDIEIIDKKSSSTRQKWFSAHFARSKNIAFDVSSSCLVCIKI